MFKLLFKSSKLRGWKFVTHLSHCKVLFLLWCPKLMKWYKFWYKNIDLTSLYRNYRSLNLNYRFCSFPSPLGWGCGASESSMSFNKVRFNVSFKTNFLLLERTSNLTKIRYFPAARKSQLPPLKSPWKFGFSPVTVVVIVFSKHAFDIS